MDEFGTLQACVPPHIVRPLNKCQLHAGSLVEQRAKSNDVLQRALPSNLYDICSTWFQALVH